MKNLNRNTLFSSSDAPDMGSQREKLLPPRSSIYTHLLISHSMGQLYGRVDSEDGSIGREEEQINASQLSHRRSVSLEGMNATAYESNGIRESEDRRNISKGFEFDPDYDTSPDHLAKLFHMIDCDGKGVLSADEIRLATANMGAYHDLTYIMQQDQITCEQFVSCVRNSASKIYNIDKSLDICMLVYDYSPKAVTWASVDFTCSYFSQSSLNDVVKSESPSNSGKGISRIITFDDFIRKPSQPAAGTVRLVCITGVEPSIIIRLAHKYYIHPLQIEDALNPGTERLKVDRSVKGIVHVLIAKISLKEESSHPISCIVREQVSIFLMQDTVLFIERSNTGVVDALTGRVTYAGSKIRLNGARYLVYSIVDTIVDQMFPIVKHFHQLLAKLENQVHSERDTPLDCVKAIQRVNRDMNAMQFYLRPLRSAVAQLVIDLSTPGPGDDPSDLEDLKRHLLDLLDHVVVLEEQAVRMAAWSLSLNEDYMNEQGHYMNKVMTLLTMVTTAFLPGQFLTGVFGMNFQYMPGLNWKYSYGFFWMLILLLSVFVFNFYRTKKWI